MANENLHMSPGNGLGLIKHYEQGPKGGFAAKRYFCSAGEPTIGWGHVILPNEKAELWDGTITEERANAILAQDMIRYENGVKKYVKVQLTQNQFDALVSFCFNAGEANLASSTLLKKVNAGDFAGAADQFLLWNKARDPKTKKLVELGGLTARRQTERHLFLNGELKFFN